MLFLVSQSPKIKIIQPGSGVRVGWGWSAACLRLFQKLSMTGQVRIHMLNCQNDFSCHLEWTQIEDQAMECYCSISFMLWGSIYKVTEDLDGIVLGNKRWLCGESLCIIDIIQSIYWLIRKIQKFMDNTPFIYNVCGGWCKIYEKTEQNIMCSVHSFTEKKA